MKTFGIIGSGSYATALYKILSGNIKTYSQDINISWFVRNQELKSYILKHFHNPKYLSSVELHLENCTLFSNLQDCINSADTVIIAIPAAFIHDSFQHVDPISLCNKKIISVVKGVIPQTHELVAEYFHNRFSVPYKNFAMLTGPSHAEEIALEKMTCLTLVSENISWVESLANVFRNEYIQVALSTDLIGIEYASVLKNVFAIAAGILHGLGYGDNYHAFFLTHAAREMFHFVETTTQKKPDILNSAYLGDLLVTCYSVHSRNRMFGNYIGKGYTVRAAQAEMNMIAEGYFAVRTLYEINQLYNVPLPILNAVYNVLYNGADAAREMICLTQQLH